jgi:hypothetical protein
MNIPNIDDNIYILDKSNDIMFMKHYNKQSSLKLIGRSDIESMMEFGYNFMSNQNKLGKLQFDRK